MRGHKADRCWQKGKGKGGKGDWEKGKGGSKGKGGQKGKWSNPGHTWDKSWYHPTWHCKTYGLEVDPWAAVEAVPYLCAVSLKPGCEEFSESKNVVRGARTYISQTKSPRNFAHVSKISILASDDEESPCECDAAKHVTRIQCQPWKGGGVRGDECSCCDERADECMTAPETKDSSHQRGSGPSKLSAHQVSYLAKSEDSKGVHQVGGSGWRSVSAIMDLGSAECVAPEDIGVTSRTDVPHCTVTTSVGWAILS